MNLVRSQLLGVVAIVASAVVLGAVPAAAGTCKAIGKLPAVIEKPGNYCVTKDLTVSAGATSAVEIAADDVTLDLGGFTLHGNATPTTDTVGVSAIERRHIVIRNGGVDGFLVGVRLQVGDLATTRSQGHLIESLHVERSTWIGIDVAGRGNVVRKNHVVATGGSTTAASTGNAFGIVAAGAMAQIYDNDVLGVVEATGVARGIQLESAPSSVVERNRIADVGFPAGAGVTLKGVGIFPRFSPRTYVAGNRMMGRMYLAIDCRTVVSSQDTCRCDGNVALLPENGVTGAGCDGMGEGNYP